MTRIRCAVFLSLLIACSSSSETSTTAAGNNNAPQMNAPKNQGGASSTPSVERPGSCNNHQSRMCCGDDLCDGPETPETCPEDCGAPGDAAEEAGGTEDAAEAAEVAGDTEDEAATEEDVGGAENAAEAADAASGNP